jgi:hypothetical protein
MLPGNVACIPVAMSCSDAANSAKHSHSLESNADLSKLLYWKHSASGMMEAVRTSETSVDNYFTRQSIPEDNSEHHIELTL